MQFVFGHVHSEKLLGDKACCKLNELTLFCDHTNRSLSCSEYKDIFDAQKSNKLPSEDFANSPCIAFVIVTWYRCIFSLSFLSEAYPCLLQLSHL